VLSLLKLIRPEFQAFLENEQKTIALIKDVAELLERVAAGPLHTPALYSTFLRALISAKIDGNFTTPNSPRMARDQQNGDVPNQMLASVEQEPKSEGLMKPVMFSSGMETTVNPMDFQSNSEMGPVADISTFPPRMAPSSTDESPGMMSMDSILSSGFWDSVLVPGYSNSLEGLSGGFVYGAGGSGFIASHLGTPIASGANSPMMSIRPELTNSLTGAYSAKA